MDDTYCTTYDLIYLKAQPHARPAFGRTLKDIRDLPDTKPSFDRDLAAIRSLPETA